MWLMKVSFNAPTILYYKDRETKEEETVGGLHETICD